MKNNEIFEWSRFKGYFKKLFIERWRTNLIRSVLLFAGLLVCIVWSSIQTYSSYSNEEIAKYNLEIPSTDPQQSVEQVVFSVAIVILGCFVASMFLHDGRRKSERIGVLTTPVSTFESWLVRWVMQIPMFLVVFFACFYVADLIRVAVFAPIYSKLPITVFSLCGEYGSVTDIMDFFIFYGACVSFYLLGGVFFPRRAVLATSIALFFLVWYYAFVFMSFSATFISIFDQEFSLRSILYRSFSVVLILFSWWLSYQRFKELEIIDRL